MDPPAALRGVRWVVGWCGSEDSAFAGDGAKPFGRMEQKAELHEVHEVFNGFKAINTIAAREDHVCWPHRTSNECPMDLLRRGLSSQTPISEATGMAS